MKVWAAAAALILGFTLSVPGTSGAASEEEQARRYEHVMQKSQELRRQAEKLRSDAAEKDRLDSVRSRAKALDEQADALVEKARTAEPAEWPPSE
jgi:hypothetical protein